MSKLKIELDVFSNDQLVYDDEGASSATGSLEEAIIAAAAAKLIGKAKEKIEKAIGEAVEARVTEMVDHIGVERIAKAIDEVIAGGWRKTDTWGNATGEVRTLGQRINDLLEQKTDNYGRGESRLDKIIREKTEAALREDFDAIIKTAKAKFSASVDGVMQAKLTETLKDALGLRT